MLRATSEIAVARSVWSVLVSSSSEAIARARCLAMTTSASDSIWITDSCSSATVAGLLPGPRQQCESFLEVEGGEHVLEGHTELHHRERDLRLDADDHRVCPTQARHAGDPLQ